MSTLNVAISKLPWPSASRPKEEPDSLTIDALAAKLEAVPVLSRVPSDKIDKIAAESELRYFNAGDVVFKKGDPAAHLNIIMSGTASMHDEHGGKPVCIVEKLGARECFGEAVMLNSGKWGAGWRIYTIVAESPLCVLTISRHLLNNELNTRLEILEALITSPVNIMMFLAESSVFKQLSLSDRARVLPMLHGRTYDVGECIIAQGEVGDQLYLLQKGTAVVEVRDRAGQHQRVAMLHSGDYFGERSVLRNEKRETSVFAIVRCHVLCMPKEKFQELDLARKLDIPLRTPVSWAAPSFLRETCPDGKKVVFKRRRPFRRLEALTRPWIAADPQKREPFATLQLTVECAEVKGSFSALYVSIGLNNRRAFLTTSSQDGNSPAWSETFSLDIYHPLSILSLQLRGRSKDPLESKQDVVIGFWDFKLSVLACSSKQVGNWFYLRSGKTFVDDLQTRMDQDIVEDELATDRIKVQLKLQCQPGDRFFAMCLPSPYIGQKIENPNLPEFYDEWQCMWSLLGQYQELFCREMNKILFWKHSGYSILMFMCAIFCAWRKEYIWPFVLLRSLVTLFLCHPETSQRTYSYVACLAKAILMTVRNPMDGMRDIKAVVGAPVDIQELRRSAVTFSMGHWDDGITAYTFSPFLQMDPTPPLPHQIREWNEMDSKIKSAVKPLEPWLSGWQGVQHDVRSVLSTLKVIDAILKWKRPHASALIATALFVAIPVLFYFQSYMRFVELLVAGFIFQAMLRYSVIGRFVSAVCWHVRWARHNTEHTVTKSLIVPRLESSPKSSRLATQALPVLLGTVCFQVACSANLWQQRASTTRIKPRTEKVLQHLNVARLTRASRISGCGLRR